MITEDVISNAAALLVAGKTDDAYFLLTSAGFGDNAAAVTKAQVTAHLLDVADSYWQQSAWSAAAGFYKTAALLSLQADLDLRLSLRSIHGLFTVLDRANDTKSLEKELNSFFPHILESADGLSKISEARRKPS